jgi:hypothetical protein
VISAFLKTFVTVPQNLGEKIPPTNSDRGLPMAFVWFGRSKADRETLIQNTIVRLALLAFTLLLGAATTFGADQTGPSSIAIQMYLPTAHIGAAYSGSASATGGVAPYQYSIVQGALPIGVGMDSNTGSITGVPSTIGNFAFSVTVVDSKGAKTTHSAQLYVLYPSDRGGVGIAVTPTGATVAPGQTQQFKSYVSGTKNTAVTWSASAGSISTLGLFTAPSASSNAAVMITATSVADPSKKASATVTIGSAGAISIAVSPQTVSVSSGSNQQFGATVQGTANTAVTWSASAGTISKAGLFTAPTVSSTTMVNVTATSAADPSKQSTATVTIMPPVSASLTITTAYLPGAQVSVAYGYPLQAIGGTTPYQWTVASGSLPQGFSLSSTGQLAGTATVTGQFSFSVKVTDAKNNTSSQSLSLSVASKVSGGGGGYDGPAQLPQVLMQTAMANTPTPGAVTMVSAGGSLQNALNSANCGDTIELAAGATFSGNVTFPAKSCDDLHWITVRTSAPDTALPPEGTRVLPCYSGVSSLPGRPAFTCPGGVTQTLAKIVDPVPSTGNSGPISFAAGANYYRLVGLEITRTVGGPDYRLVGGKGTADHIILDRVWLHGSPQDDNMTAFGLDGMSYAALIDSYANDFHCTSVVGVCTDAKVIGGGTGGTQDGPYKIVDNFLEASGENILFGGGGAAYTPADIEIRGNHFYKPLTWMKGQPGFVGGASGYPFMVKNHLELKNAQRVLVEGNIFEYTWGGFSQVGFSILLTPKNQAAKTGNVCPICAVTDVTIRYNKISHSGTGIAFANATSDNGGVALAGGRYSVHDITIDDVSASKYSGSGGMFQVWNNWPANVLNNVSIDHVTVFPDPISRFIAISSGMGEPPMSGFAMTNSIVGQNKFAIWNAGGGNSCAISNVPVTELNTCFPGGYTFADNAIIDGTAYYSSSKWPAANFFPASASTVQFVNFNGGNGGDYHLVSGSPYKNAGTDGKDIGADIDAILTATANAY